MNHLDLRYIIENVTDDQAFIEELLIIFLEGLGEDYPVLMQEISTSNHEGIRQAAHKLKSSFRSLGMKNGWHALQEIEDLGTAGAPLNQIKDKVDEFNLMIPEVKSEVRLYIDQHKP
jgi:HPt (histidine-containing phosphotransfer) domain-containing protein